MTEEVIQEPNLVIFRLPDEEGERMFVEIPYLGDVLHKQGTKFMINVPEDSYLTMGFHHIVLARKTNEGSLDLLRLIFDERMKENAPPIHTLDYPTLVNYVKEAIDVFKYYSL